MLQGTEKKKNNVQMSHKRAKKNQHTHTIIEFDKTQSEIDKIPKEETLREQTFRTENNEKLDFPFIMSSFFFLLSYA
jgi:hypothetical protein